MNILSLIALVIICFVILKIVKKNISFLNFLRNENSKSIINLKDDNKNEVLNKSEILSEDRMTKSDDKNDVFLENIKQCREKIKNDINDSIEAQEKIFDQKYSESQNVKLKLSGKHSLN